MKIVRTKSELRNLLVDSTDIGLVPTMGALHEGHLELVRAARKDCKTCVVSVFVNPTQFGPNEDFAQYPRDEARDAELCSAEGVDIFFAPDVDQMYGESMVTVHVSTITDHWEGAIRPGHFDGVSTIVLKLLNIVSPHVAFFGLKDLQQCAVVSALVRDLDVPVTLKLIETVREQSGLAMSSRNRRLSESDLALAATLYKSLAEASLHISARRSVKSEIENCVNALTSAGFAVDYVALVDPETMRELSIPTPNSRIIAAARLGGVRLLDNLQASAT